MTFRLQGVIFDMDGVITDTIPLHYESWARLAQAEDIPFSWEEHDTMRGLSRRDALARLLKGRELAPNTFDDWMARKNGHYRELMTTLTPADILPGVHDWLAAARQMGLRVGLGSASQNAHAVLAQLGLSAAFDAIADGISVVHIKPAPDIFLWVAGRINVHPAHTLVIEDSAAGISAARAGGFWTLGVGSHEVVGAAHIVTASLADLTLVEVIAQLPQADA
ncbi:MAG: beta-phosphoglucomutase [Armatimonadetes bacterium]|nr:beta-phosphoglucomutase [Anaerolineae bacterium]